jgi:Carboxypeptidase regulatory-like domain
MFRLNSNPSQLGPLYRLGGTVAILATFLLITFSVPLVQAKKEEKPSRTVAGVVTDEGENPIAGAVVVLTDLQTGKKNATYTGADGAYQYAGLQVTRDYEIQASYKGISSQLRKVSSVDPRKRVTVNLRIPPPKEE